MRLTVKQLRNLIREAVGDRGYPGDKAHLICYVIAQGGGKMARPDIMKKVEEIEGKDPANFKPTTNISYWSPATMVKNTWQRDEQGQIVFDPETHRPVVTGQETVPNTSAGHAARFGVLRRGLVKVAGKKVNKLLYELTPEGQKFADETAAWLEANPDAYGNIAPKPMGMGYRDEDV